MNNDKKRPKKRRSLMGAAKTLIASLSLAGVLGFWSLFSQQSKPDPSVLAAETNISLVQPVDPVLALDLPPMPTLIPPLDTSTIVQQPAAAPVVQPELRPGSTVVLSGSKPSSGGGGGADASAGAGSSAGAGAVTVTQSSK